MSSACKVKLKDLSGNISKVSGGFPPLALFHLQVIILDRFNRYPSNLSSEILN